MENLSKFRLVSKTADGVDGEFVRINPPEVNTRYTEPNSTLTH